MTKTVTIAEFMNHTGKSEFANRVVKAWVVNGLGISETGFAVASSSVLNAVATWIRNGAM